MSEVFITRKGGGGKSAAPTLTVTSVGGSWIEFEVTNTDQTNQATIFLLANYDTNSATDFDILAAQNGQVLNVAADTTVSTIISGLDNQVTHTISAQAAVIKKLPSSIVTTAPTDLLQTELPAPTIGPVTETDATSITVTVKNNDLDIPVIIRAVATTNTTVPTNYPFATASLGPDTATSLTITGLSELTTYYIHARAFDGAIQSANVVFGPYTLPEQPLYAFTSWTFTNAGVTGQNGPNITQVRGAYSSQTWAQNNDYLAMTTNGIQNWTVPQSGSYQIQAFGAGNNGAGGARMRGDFTFTKGDTIRILVGHRSTSSIGGSGGTFVTTLNNSPLIIAGGTGGVTNNATRDRTGRTTTNGGQGADGSSTGGAAGGTNGSGGGGAADGCGCGGGSSGGGGGLTGNGAGNGGVAFVNGGVGSGNGGGFGSGGGFGAANGAGGGGGYSGGGGGGCGCCSAGSEGGGGGSINNGTNQSNSANANDNFGRVEITKL